MTPEWTADTVRAFGRQLGLEHFGLNDRGAAGVVFENGRSLRLELTEGAIVMSVGLGAPSDVSSYARLLTEAHPQAQAKDGGTVRAVCLLRTGEAYLTLRLNDDEITVAALGQAFDRLWERAETLGRAMA